MRILRAIFKSGLALVVGCGGSTTQAPPSRTESPGPSAPIQVGALASWLAESASRIAVDLREPELFAAGHIHGAVNLQAGYEQFAIRASRFFGSSAELVLLAKDAAVAAELAQGAHVGVRVRAWLDAPASACRSVAELGWTKQKTIRAKSAADLLARGDALLIDARTAKEYADGHAPGAMFVYPDDFPRQAPFLRRDASVIVVCQAGWRSSLLVSWMDRLGFRDARNLIGGMDSWRAEGCAIEKGSEQKAFR